MPHELFLFRLMRWLPILGLLSFPLYGVAYTFSEEKVLETFFKDLFENTTAGYVIYGQKPVDLEGFSVLEQTIPGTFERRASVTGLLALKYWNEIAPNSKNQNYILIDFPNADWHEITLINRKAFLDVVKANSLLFDYKLGSNLTPDDLLQRFMQNGFSSLFKESAALQGIILGYGVENSISYECGSSCLKRLTPIASPPNQLISTSKHLKMKGNNWIQDLTCYRAPKNDRLKIPFSFIKDSNKSKDLLKLYRKYQDNVDGVLGKKTFLVDVLQRFGTKLGAGQAIQSDQLIDFFTTSERKHLSRIVAQTILNTFSNEMSPSLIQGMRTAETENTLECSDVKFLDILWKRDPMQSTHEFFAQISGQQNVRCLIPGKLFIRTLKESDSDEVLTKHHHAIKVQYLLKDIENNPLAGSYQLEDPPTLYLDKLIPGLAHGLLGMKKGEVREIFIHPDFVYGVSSDFGSGGAITAVVELIHLGEKINESALPFLKPVDVSHYAPDITSCSEFVNLQKKHAYACGFRSWLYYKKASPLITLDIVLSEMAKLKKMALPRAESDLLLKLEWLFLGY